MIVPEHAVGVTLTAVERLMPAAVFVPIVARSVISVDWLAAVDCVPEFVAMVDSDVLPVV